MQLSELYLDRYLYRDNTQTLATQDSAFVSADSSTPAADSIPSGGAAQDINTGNVTINGTQLTPGTYPQPTLDVSNWGWGQTCTFSPSNQTTVIWGSGTFRSASGISYSISAGSTGSMGGRVYIYLSLLDSSTAYQVTTIPSMAVGIGKVLVAVANPSSVTGTSATYNLSEATQIVGDNILANTIYASKLNVGQLSAITADFGTMTAGTITGVLFQTSSATNTGIKISSSLGGVQAFGQSFLIYDTSGNLQGYLGAYGGYLNLQAASGVDVLLGSATGHVAFANDITTVQAGGGLVGSPSAPWNTIYGGNFVGNNYYEAGGSERLHYSSSSWQSSTDFKITGSAFTTGQVFAQGAVYINSTSSSTGWKIVVSGTNLLIQQYYGSQWVTRSTITGQ